MGSGENECFICLTDETNEIFINCEYLTGHKCNCKFIIHESCWSHWSRINNKCPICHISLSIVRQEVIPIDLMNYFLNIMLCIFTLMVLFCLFLIMLLILQIKVLN